MKRQLQGIALILFSILLSLTFSFMGIRWVFDLDIKWQQIFIIVALVGIVLVFKNPKDKCRKAPFFRFSRRKDGKNVAYSKDSESNQDNS